MDLSYAFMGKSDSPGTGGERVAFLPDHWGRKRCSIVSRSRKTADQGSTAGRGKTLLEPGVGKWVLHGGAFALGQKPRTGRKHPS